MISVLNFKKFERGSMLGYFDLRYHGLTVKGYRLMAGSNGGGIWFSFPQREDTDESGSSKYFDLMYLTPPEREHVRKLVLMDLQQLCHLERPKSKPQGNGGRRSAGQGRSPEGEDLSEYYSEPGGDIPF